MQQNQQGQMEMQQMQQQQPNQQPYQQVQQQPIQMQQQPMMMMQGGNQMNQQQMMMMQQQQQQQMMMQQQQQMMMMQGGAQMMQPGAQMMQVGGQMMPVAIQLKPIFGMDKLSLLKGVFVKQKFELLEAITGCETENKYEIYGIKPDGEKDKKNKLFKCKEKSGFFERQCLTGECRPFKLKIEHDSGLQNDGQMFIECERECVCTVMCLNRPKMQVNLVENGNAKLFGSVYAPWKLCELGIDIRDDKEETMFKIRGSCCQLGVWYKNMPCEACQTVDFLIFDAKGEKTDGFLQKQTKGCLKAALGDADNFSLLFPSNITPEQKALLMCSVIFLDFRYFEDKQQNNNNNNRGFSVNF